MVLTIATLCLVFAGWVAVGNLVGMGAACSRNWRGKSGGYSSVPILSAVFGLIAFGLAKDSFGWWSFLPAVLDPGTWVIVALPISLPCVWFCKRP